MSGGGGGRRRSVSNWFPRRLSAPASSGRGIRAGSRAGCGGRRFHWSVVAVSRFRPPPLRPRVSCDPCAGSGCAAPPRCERRGAPAMRHVLLISYTFPPENVPAAARAGQLFKFLPDYGYQPVVVAAPLAGWGKDDPSVHRVPAGNGRMTSSLAATAARWAARFFAPYEDRWAWVPYATAAAADIIKANAIDAIFTTSPSLAAQFAGLWLKGRFGLPWVADFQDPVRDNPFRTRRWFYPYDALIERGFFRWADHLAANTDTVAAAWRARYPQWREKISVLWNSYDPLEPIATGETARRPERVLAHIGSLYDGRHPRQLLESVERLKIEPSCARIKLVGPIAPAVLAEHGALFERVRHSGVLTYGNRVVSRDEALAETAGADYLVLLDVNEKNASFQVPSKLLDYIRVGKPILAYTPTGSPVERILARSGIAHTTIDPLAPPEISDRKLLEFLRLPPETRPASRWFVETFSARTQARIVAGLLDAVLQAKTARAGLALERNRR